MNGSEQMTLWVGALRYYMGRRSYAVGMFCDALRAHWTELPADVREIIRRDVECEIRRDDRARADGSTYRPLGHDCDRKQWEGVRELWGTPEGGGEIA